MLILIHVPHCIYLKRVGYFSIKVKSLKLKYCLSALLKLVVKWYHAKSGTFRHVLFDLSFLLAFFMSKI